MTPYTRKRFLIDSAMITAGIAFNKILFAQSPPEYTWMSITELSKLIRNKKISPVEITRACLKRIELLNPTLNAFITVTAEQALKEAKIAETAIRKGKWIGPLHGIPIALKDNIDTAGVKTTAASGVFKERIPTKDAEIVRKLKNAGAVFLGKLNMHEFALGTTSVNSFFGPVHNPWNKEYIAGGSSGGSAAAVAAGLCYGAMATDTGGSIRLPASCCGVTGFKPTYGLVSIQGIIPVVQSIDHAGPITRTVEDAAIFLNALASPSKETNDSKKDYQSFKKIRNPVIGIVSNYKASDEVDAIFKKAVITFQSLGFTTKNVVLPSPPASAFGDVEIDAYHHTLVSQFKDLYDPATINDINGLKKLSSIEYIRQKNRMEENRITISEQLFKNIDVLILPTTTAATPSILEAKEKGPFTLEPINTDIFNEYGLPAVSIPCGFSKNGLPLGLQIVGSRWEETTVLYVAQKYQQATVWHLQHPKMQGR